jgi:electron transport complex protein RnfC
MHKGYLDEFLLIYEALKAVFGFERVSMCVHEKDRKWFSDYAERAGDLYAMLYVPNRYSPGPGEDPYPSRHRHRGALEGGHA